jgi:hypothetical protein
VGKAFALATLDEVQEFPALSCTGFWNLIPFVVMPMLSEHGYENVVTQSRVTDECRDQVVFEIVAIITEVFELNHA